MGGGRWSKWTKTCKHRCAVPRKWLKKITSWLSCQSHGSQSAVFTGRHRPDGRIQRKSRRENFFLSVWDLTAEGPIGSKEGPHRTHRAALPLVGSVDRRIEVRGNNGATGSEAGWSTYRSNEALLPNLRAQRHREVLFTLYSRFSVEFGSVESSCVAIDWFCVCTADHTSVIFTIIIEIYRVVVFLLWSPPGLSPALWFYESEPHWKPSSEVILSKRLLQSSVSDSWQRSLTCTTSSGTRLETPDAHRVLRGSRVLVHVVESRVWSVDLIDDLL